MQNNSFTYTFKTSKEAEKLYSLLLEVDQWWSGLFGENITGESRKAGDEFVFKAGGGLHDTKQKLIELIPGKKVTWEVVDSHLSFLKDTGEWTGTKISFELARAGNETLVTFSHDGLTPGMECYEACSGAWNSYLDNLKKKLS
ncbi:MAG: SRPBCC family protein [Bacteroidia bacterium]|jgi:hypothetical protein